MISDFAFVLSAAWDLLGMEFTLYGFTMSFKSIMLPVFSRIRQLPGRGHWAESCQQLNTIVYYTRYIYRFQPTFQRLCYFTQPIDPMACRTWGTLEPDRRHCRSLRMREVFESPTPRDPDAT